MQKQVTAGNGFHIIKFDKEVAIILSLINTREETTQISGLNNHLLNFKGLMIDEIQRVIIRENHEIELTYTEFEILKLLAKHPGIVFSKEQIYDIVWRESYSGDYNIVMSHIRNIREKIEDNPSKPIYIQTVWGVGYRFNQKRVTINLNDEVERAVNTEKIILLVLSKIESCKIPR